MIDIEPRLLECFKAVFPELEPGSLPAARADEVEGWDSLRSLVLMSVVEEAFAIRIPTRDYLSLRSYVSILRYLQGARGESTSGSPRAR